MKPVENVENFLSKKHGKRWDSKPNAEVLYGFSTIANINCVENSRETKNLLFRFLN